MYNSLILKDLIKELGLSVSTFERSIGVGASAINKAISRNTSLKKDTIDKIIKTFPNVNPEWLVTGKGEMFIKPKKEYSSFTSNATLISVSEDSESYQNRFGNVFEPLEDGNYLMQVPIIAEYARGGRMAGFSDKEYFDELPKHTVVVDKIHRGKYLSFKVAGESMDFDGRDAILDGAIVTGRELKQELWRNSKLHLNKYKDFIIAGADGICVKRIIEHNVEEGYVVCHSLNPNKAKHKDFTLQIDDIDALFNIIKVENPR